MRRHLISEVISILRETGFIVSSVCDARSFDLAARRDDITLLVKALQNIDAVSEEVARSMKRAAFFLIAAPLIVGERKGGLPLEDNILYYRYGIPAVNMQTLYDYFIAEMTPCAYSTSGGIFVSIDGEAMQEARKRKKLSLGDIASALGVSRRSVSRYEQGASTTIEIALKLEDILETKLIQHLDMLKTVKRMPHIADKQPRTSLERHILKKMERIGLEIFTISFAPFNAVSVHEGDEQRHAEGAAMTASEHSKQGGGDQQMAACEDAHEYDESAMQECERILTGISKCTAKLIKRAKMVSSISEITDTKSVFVVNGKIKRLQIDRTILIRRDELEKMRDADEFTCIIEERAVDAHANAE